MDASTPNKWKWFVLAIGVAAFFCALGITTGNGPGLDPDSMAYVGAATSLSHGRGLQVPLGKWEEPDSSVQLTLWPPAFPAAMALPQAAGLSPVSSARLILALSAAATAALSAMILGGLLSTPLVLVAVALILITPSFVGVHLSILSEPLFIASLALTLLAMVRARPGLAAIGAALSVMTRYAGASAAIGTAIWFLFFEKGALRKRLTRSAISSAPAALCFILWTIRNSRVKVVQSAFDLGYYPGITSTLKEGLATLFAWLVPRPGEPSAALIAVLAVAALGTLLLASRGKLVALRESPSTDRTRISAASVVQLSAYLAVLIASRLLVGGAIRFDARILAPAIFLIELALIPALATALAHTRRPIRLAGVAVVAVWMIASLSAEAPVVVDSIEDGNDFAASDWRESPTTEWIETEGRNFSIYTNWPAAVYFDAHRNAFDIPTFVDSDTLAQFGRVLESRHGVLAAFNVKSPDYPSIDSIAAGAGLVKLRTLPDGIIWAPKRNAN